MGMNILIIDDDNFTRKLFVRYLTEGNETLLAEDGPIGLEKAAQEQPDIIILDVEMPGMNGYEVCDRLKNDIKTAHIPIIFVSGRDSLTERMQGYEVGGDDYIVKPFEPETLLAKVKVFGKHYQDKSELKDQCETAQKTAQIAMTGSSELGLAMQFVESSYSIYNYADLANSMFAVTSRLNLNCTLMVATNDGFEYFSSAGAVTPLEEQLLSLMCQEKRIYDFGFRTIINYSNVSLLVKNMPVGNIEDYGRIKDLLPTILSAVNGKIFSLNTEYALVKQSQELSTTMESVKDALLNMTNSLKQNQKKGLEILNEMLLDLNSHLPNMGLEEDQEQYILKCVESAIDNSDSVTDADDQLNTTFHHIVDQLKQISENYHDLIDKMQSRQQQETISNEEEYSMDVELF